MGFIRKAISGSLAIGTGGMSLPFVQFRSDTERGTAAINQLAEQLADQHAELLALEAQKAVEVEVERQAGELGAALTSSAAGVVKRRDQAATEPVGRSISARLEDIERLGRLRSAGVLSEEEFNREKAAILRTLG